MPPTHTHNIQTNWLKSERLRPSQKGFHWKLEDRDQKCWGKAGKWAGAAEATLQAEEPRTGRVAVGLGDGTEGAGRLGTRMRLHFGKEKLGQGEGIRQGDWG